MCDLLVSPTRYNEGKVLCKYMFFSIEKIAEENARAAQVANNQQICNSGLTQLLCSIEFVFEDACRQSFSLQDNHPVFREKEKLAKTKKLTDKY